MFFNPKAKSKVCAKLSYQVTKDDCAGSGKTLSIIQKQDAVSTQETSQLPVAASSKSDHS